MSLVESWFITNNYFNPLALSDIISPYTIQPGQTIDLLKIGNNTPENLANSVIIRNYSSKIITKGNNKGKNYISAVYNHSHTGLSVLTGGSKSNADNLHTHNQFTTDNDVNKLIEEAITNTIIDPDSSTEPDSDLNLTIFVEKSGSINQLSDIISTGYIIEDAVSKAHQEHIHNDLSGLNDGEYKHLTSANYTNFATLTSNGNADGLHSHSHNILSTLQGGVANKYYHLTQTQHDILTDGSNADSLHSHSGGGVSIHNDLTEIQGGVDNEFFHLTEDKYDIVSKFDEDSSGITFDGVSLLDSLWRRSGSTLFPINANDSINLGTGNITGTDLDISAGTGTYLSSGTITTTNGMFSNDLTVEKSNEVAMGVSVINSRAFGGVDAAVEFKAFTINDTHSMGKLSFLRLGNYDPDDGGFSNNSQIKLYRTINGVDSLAATHDDDGMTIPKNLMVTVGGPTMTIGSISISSNSGSIAFNDNNFTGVGTGEFDKIVLGESSLFFDGTDLNITLNDPSQNGVIKFTDSVEVSGDLNVLGDVFIDGNISGDGINISAGTGDYISTGTIDSGDITVTGDLTVSSQMALGSQGVITSGVSLFARETFTTTGNVFGLNFILSLNPSATKTGVTKAINATMSADGNNNITGVISNFYAQTAGGAGTKTITEWNGFVSELQSTNFNTDIVTYHSFLSKEVLNFGGTTTGYGFRHTGFSASTNDAWAFYADANNSFLGPDGVKTFWGTDKDASIFFDGEFLNIDFNNPSDQNGLKIKGLTFWEGPGSGLPYGNMDQDGGTFEVFLEFEDQLYELDAVTTHITSGPLNRVTFVGGRRLKVSIAGDYFVVYSLVAQIDGLTGGSEHVEFEVLKNGTAMSKGETHVDFKNTVREFPLGSTTIITLAADDELSLGVVAVDSSGKTITIDHLEISMFMAGGA